MVIAQISGVSQLVLHIPRLPAPGLVQTASLWMTQAGEGMGRATPCECNARSQSLYNL